jgi:hypothetical protein
MVEDKHALIYLQEVITQAEFARVALDQLSQALQEGVNGNAKIWASTQSLLASAAMISKLLWPSPPSTKADGSQLDSPDARRRSFTIDRGKDLRRRLGVKAQPILQSRQVRNAFEHFDERLDGHIDAGNSFRNDRNVGPRSLFAVGRPRFMALRHLDPEVPSVSVLDAEVNLEDLWIAIEDMCHRATKAIAKIRHQEDSLEGSGRLRP